jgi:hypothetical protein
MSPASENEMQSGSEQREKTHNENDVHIPRQTRKRIMLGKLSGDLLCDSGVDNGAELNDAHHGGHQKHENATENSHFSKALGI